MTSQIKIISKPFFPSSPTIFARWHLESNLPEWVSCQHWCLVEDSWLPPLNDGCISPMNQLDKVLNILPFATLCYFLSVPGLQIKTKSKVVHLKYVAAPDNWHNTDRGTRSIDQSLHFSTRRNYLWKTFFNTKSPLFLRTFYLSWNHGGQPCQGLFSQNAHQSITQLIKIQLLVDLSLFGHFELSLPSGTPLWEDLCPSSWWGGRWLLESGSPCMPGGVARWNLGEGGNRCQRMTVDIATHYSSVPSSWLLTATATDPRSSKDLWVTHTPVGSAADIETLHIPVFVGGTRLSAALCSLYGLKPTAHTTFWFVTMQWITMVRRVYFSATGVLHIFRDHMC